MASLGSFAVTACDMVAESPCDTEFSFMGMKVHQGTRRNGEYELTAYTVRSLEGIVWIAALALRAEKSVTPSFPADVA